MKLQITNIRVKLPALVGLSEDYDALAEILTDWKQDIDINDISKARLDAYYLRTHIAMAAEYDIDFDVKLLDEKALVINDLQQQEWSADVFDDVAIDRYVKAEDVVLMHPTSFVVDTSVYDDCHKIVCLALSDSDGNIYQALRSIAMFILTMYLPIDIRVNNQ